MTVRLGDGGVIALEGDCPIEDAEPLLQLLLAHVGAAVDWTGCDSLHTGIVQILLAARREMRGPPRSVHLRVHVAAALARAFGDGDKVFDERPEPGRYGTSAREPR